MPNRKARLLLRKRLAVSQASFADMVIWEVPTSVPGSNHRYKYRLAFVVHGECVVRYDNESRKGDHRHYGDREFDYAFAGNDQLLADFVSDIRRCSMRTVLLGVQSLEDAARDMVAVLDSGHPEEVSRINFATAELLWQVLTTKRWQILRVMCGVGRVSLREVARRVGRDVKSVHSDVSALVAVGLVDRSAQGVEFPYDEIKVEFVLRAA